MEKVIYGRLWYCCDRCGKKLFPIANDAQCKGVFMRCRQCGREWEIVINRGANNGKHKEDNRGAGSIV